MPGATRRCCQGRRVRREIREQGQRGAEAERSPPIREDLMTSFTRTEIQKAKLWGIIAQKNKGVLHISWLPDRISTASIPWLSFHSFPKTSLSSGGARRREWERSEHRRAPGSVSQPAACGEGGSARCSPCLPSPLALSQTPVHGGQPDPHPSAAVPSPASPSSSSRHCPGLRVSAAEVVRGGSVPAAWSDPRLSARQTAGEEPRRLFPKLGELSEPARSSPPYPGVL